MGGGGVVIPITTPEEMRRVDEEAPEPVEVLIDRAGGALARAAVDMLGGTYGLSLIHISEPTRPPLLSRMPSSA